MALPPLIKTDELASWLSEPVAGERGDLVVAGVSGVIRDETRKTWVDDDNELIEIPDTVRTVAFQVAARVWRNPEGARQQVTGPYSVAWDRETGLGVVLSDDERALLARYNDSGAPTGLWTLGTTRGPLETAGPYEPVTEWVDTVYSQTNTPGEAMPWPT